MKVYFEDRYGRHREIGEADTRVGVNKIVYDFLDAHNFKSYYTRNWIAKNELGFCVMYDVGSHTEFFFVPFDTKEDAEGFIKGYNV